MIKQRTILIVEDEFISAKMLEKLLTQFYNYQVCGLVATGELAIARAGEAHPDIVLMDIRLASEMDGIEAAATIQSMYNIPIVFITGYATDQYKTQCKALNPVAILEKPVHPDKLNEVIQSAFCPGL